MSCVLRLLSQQARANSMMLADATRQSSDDMIRFPHMYERIRANWGHADTAIYAREDRATALLMRMRHVQQHSDQVGQVERAAMHAVGNLHQAGVRLAQADWHGAGQQEQAHGQH